jgi:hypothetical protein
MAQKSYRVIAKNTALKLRTVNIVTTVFTEKRSKSGVQVGPTAPIGVIETVMDSAGTVAGLPTLHIPGYAGPS